MSSPVLTAGATLMCPHAGVATSAAAANRVKVLGQPVCTAADRFAIMTTPCPLKPLAPATTPTPCQSMQDWAGSATRVKSSGLPVLLATSQAMCIGIPGGPSTTVPPVQSRVKGI